MDSDGMSLTNEEKVKNEQWLAEFDQWKNSKIMGGNWPKEKSNIMRSDWLSLTNEKIWLLSNYILIQYFKILWIVVVVLEGRSSNLQF
jgi:hypothetical protein